MSELSIVTTAVALVLLGVMVEMLRRRQLSEKYAALWLAVSVVSLPFAVSPHLFDVIARALGIVSGVSLVLFGGVVFLLLVCMHLSWETSRLEEETRVLAEEVALLRAEREPGDFSAQ